MELFSLKKSIKLNNTCSICLDDGKQSIIIYECNQCKKQFHKKCIEKWLKYKNECPNCRYSNFDIDDELIRAVLYYNEFAWHNFEYHYNMSQFFHMIAFLVKVVIFTVVFMVTLIIYFYKSN